MANKEQKTIQNNEIIFFLKSMQQCDFTRFLHYFLVLGLMRPASLQLECGRDGQITDGSRAKGFVREGLC